MERTALRLATCAALLNGGNGNPWPTVAEKYVYDSMQDDLVDVVPNRRRPVAIIKTDEDSSTYRNYNLAGRQCRLIIEIGVLTTVTVKLSTGAEELKQDWPRTDAAIEAFLDMFEWQVQNALFGYSDWAMWWKACVTKEAILGYQSIPRYSPPEHGSVRLAVRGLIIPMALAPECVIQPIKEFGPPPVGVLPPNWSKVVASIIENGGGDFKKAVEQQIRTIARYGTTTQPVYPQLQRIWATLPEWNIEAEWRFEQEAPFTAKPIVTPQPELDTPLAGEVAP